MGSSWASLLFLIIFTNSVVWAWEGRLSLQDNFDKNYLRREIWEYKDHCDGKGTEKQVLECAQRGGNMEIKNGTLIITARPGGMNEPLFTTGAIRTYGTSGFSYGTFVIRAQLPKGKHLLPSIWLVPVNQHNDVCRYEEIDILESRGQRPSTLIYSAMYGRSYTKSSVRKYEKVFRGIDFSEGFHEFALRWTPTRLQWFMDGRKVYEMTTHFKSDWEHSVESYQPCSLTRNSVQPMFGQESHLVISLGVGGVSFPPEQYGVLRRDEALKWPKPTLEIDYVRVYQD
ncbi:unnamed protein product [Allacma fusca]|uniref:GH16 domain-containing protein n=1 Tax=Allacma fusca TaxID=39272 RepID=A0A8J2P7X3_9HEXA|nr:unnamed protein product [Allacma fusca]